jgi:hypothetical protein
MLLASKHCAVAEQNDAALSCVDPLTLALLISSYAGWRPRSAASSAARSS